VPAGPVGDDGKLKLAVVIIQLQAGEGVGPGGSINAQGVGGAVLTVCGYRYQQSEGQEAKLAVHVVFAAKIRGLGLIGG
jgi:hypothetical protein